jgi:RND family efflux transporter MFP subunit
MRLALAVFLVAAGIAAAIVVKRQNDRPQARHATEETAPQAVSPEPTKPADAGFIGVVLAGDSVQVEAEVSARIEQIFVKPGDVIGRGAPIAQLDIHGMKSELAVAEASAAEATGRLARRAHLARDGFAAITPEELDNAKFDAAREQARAASLMRSVVQARIVAPFDGTIAEQYLGRGALAGPGRPIVRLVGKGVPRVRFAVPQEQETAVTPNVIVSIVLPGTGQRASGTVVSVTREVDNASGMVYAVATLDAHGADSPFARGGLVVRVLAPAGGEAGSR